jgi:hypothetical protein
MSVPGCMNEAENICARVRVSANLMSYESLLWIYAIRSNAAQLNRKTVRSYNKASKAGRA